MSSPFVTYELLSKYGKRVLFKEKACFSGMRSLNNGIKSRSRGNWESMERDPLEYIIIYPKNKANLNHKIVYKWLSYLWNHHYFGKMLVSRGMDEITIKVGNESGAVLLMLCTLVRYIDELPTALSSFYNMTSLDYVVNNDIAILLSNFFNIDENGVCRGRIKATNGFSFNSNHHILNTTNHTDMDIVKYAASFPYQSMLPSYNEDFNFGGTYNYLSSGKGTKIRDKILRFRKSGLYGNNLFKNMVLTMQKEVRKYDKG